MLRRTQPKSDRNTKSDKGSWGRLSEVFSSRTSVDHKAGAKVLLDAIGSDLEPRIREQLESIVHHVAYPAKTILFREGDEPTAVYCVLSGRVSVYHRHQVPDAVSEGSGSEWHSDDDGEERRIYFAIDGATNLNCGNEVKIDPFVKVKLGEQSFETPVSHESDACPVWMYKDSLPVEHGVKELIFEVWEYDKFSRNDFLGSGTIPLKKVHADIGFNGEIELQIDPEAAPGSGGCLQVRINWDEQALFDSSTPPGSHTHASNSISLGQAVDGVLAVRKTDRMINNSMGFQINSIGPGALLGELSMLSDDTRSAGARCETDVELAKVEKADFERLLKQDLQRAQMDKRAFFNGCLPGLSNLPSKNADELLYYFRKHVVTRGHCFLKQGSLAADKSIFFIQNGHVELSWQDYSSGAPHQKGVTIKVGLMGPGQVFGTLKKGEKESLSAVASSASVEVFSVRVTQLWRFPHKILSEIQAKVRLTSVWHSKRCVEGVKATLSHNETSNRSNTETQSLASKSRGLMSSPFLRSKSSFLPTGFADSLERNFPMYKPNGYDDRFPARALTRSCSQSSAQSKHLSCADERSLSEGAVALRSIAQKYAAGPERLFRPVLSGLQLGVPESKQVAPSKRRSTRMSSVSIGEGAPGPCNRMSVRMSVVKDQHSE